MSLVVSARRMYQINCITNILNSPYVDGKRIAIQSN
jgi:hypothetical protein